MTEAEKLQKRRRQIAAKLTNPKVRELPSGMFRAEKMVNGERLSETGPDPEMVHAALNARAKGLIERKERGKMATLTVGDAVDEYIASRKNVCSVSTVVGYKSIRENRFPELMAMRVFDVSPKDLQAAVNEDAAVVGYKTLKNALRVVVPAIEQYRPIDVEKIKLPQRRKRKPKYLDEGGIIELFDAIRGDPFEVPILIAVWLGLRRSEICGLCWDSIDFQRKRIIVQRTYLWGDDKAWHLVELNKTEESEREVDCPDYILSRIAALQPDEQSRVGRLFTFQPNSLYRAINRVCRQHDLMEVGVHGLRHTNASVMLSLGIIDRIAMARGGWSTDITMKQVYQHLFQSDITNADQRINEHFEALATGKPVRKELRTDLRTENSKPLQD